MPTYDYRCKACGHEFEEFQSMSAKPLRKCPSCAKLQLERLIGTGAALIFKGSGFYETDYRSDSYQKAADADKKSAEAPAASDSSKGTESGTADKKGAEKPAPAPAPATKAEPSKKAASADKPKGPKKTKD